MTDIIGSLEKDLEVFAKPQLGSGGLMKAAPPPRPRC